MVVSNTRKLSIENQIMEAEHNQPHTHTPTSILTQYEIDKHFHEIAWLYTTIALAWYAQYQQS